MEYQHLQLSGGPQQRSSILLVTGKPEIELGIPSRPFMKCAPFAITSKTSFPIHSAAWETKE